MTCAHPVEHRTALQPSGWTVGTGGSLFLGTWKDGSPAVIVVCLACSTFWDATPTKAPSSKQAGVKP